jgi:hypothetical protein
MRCVSEEIRSRGNEYVMREVEEELHTDGIFFCWGKDEISLREAGGVFFILRY